MTCRFRWNLGHRPLVSIQLCLVLLPPSSSSCTCILLSTFLSPDLFSKYSLVASPFHLKSHYFRPNFHVEVHRPQSTVFHYPGGRWAGRGAGRPGCVDRSMADWRRSRQSAGRESRDVQRHELWNKTVVRRESAVWDIAVQETVK